MGLCDTPSDNLGWILAAYVGALFPWAVLPVLDPLGRAWSPFHIVQAENVVYAIVSLIPYATLVPYAILQSCAEEKDHKEMLAAIIAIFVSTFNLIRARRGLLAIVDVRSMWKAVEADGLRKVDCELGASPTPLHQVLLNYTVVDNDWPGEAPRVAYRLRIRNNRLRLHVQAIDARNRLCMYALWSLWMLTNPQTRQILPYPDGSQAEAQRNADGGGAVAMERWTNRFRDDFYFLRHEQKSDDSLEPFTIAMIIAACLRESPPSHSSSSRVAAYRRHKGSPRVTPAPPGLKQSAVREFVNLVYRPLHWFVTFLQTCSILLLPTAKKTNLEPFSFESVGFISKRVLDEQLSKLPHSAQYNLEWVTPHIAQECAVHYELHRAGFNSVTERMTAALGLPDCCHSILQQWWQPETDSSHQRSRTPRRLKGVFAAFIAILGEHRRLGDRTYYPADRGVLERKLDYLISRIKALRGADIVIEGLTSTSPLQWRTEDCESTSSDENEGGALEVFKRVRTRTPVSLTGGHNIRSTPTSSSVIDGIQPTRKASSGKDSIASASGKGRGVHFSMPETAPPSPGIDSIQSSPAASLGNDTIASTSAGQRMRFGESRKVPRVWLGNTFLLAELFRSEDFQDSNLRNYSPFQDALDSLERLFKDELRKPTLLKERRLSSLSGAFFDFYANAEGVELCKFTWMGFLRVPLHVLETAYSFLGLASIHARLRGTVGGDGISLEEATSQFRSQADSEVPV